MKFTPSPYPSKLPHFDIGQAYYHLIFRLREGFLTDEEIALLKQHIEEGNGKHYRLIGIQVMTNHVHLVLQPSENMRLSEVVRRIKGSSARKLNLHRGNSGSIWSDKYFDRIIRNADDFEKTLLYLEQNPVKAGIVEGGSTYQGWEFHQS